MQWWVSHWKKLIMQNLLVRASCIQRFPNFIVQTPAVEDLEISGKSIKIVVYFFGVSSWINGVLPSPYIQHSWPFQQALWMFFCSRLSFSGQMFNIFIHVGVSEHTQAPYMCLTTSYFFVPSEKLWPWELKKLAEISLFVLQKVPNSCFSFCWKKKRHFKAGVDTVDT